MTPRIFQIDPRLAHRIMVRTRFAVLELRDMPEAGSTQDSLLREQLASGDLTISADWVTPVAWIGLTSYSAEREHTASHPHMFQEPGVLPDSGARKKNPHCYDQPWKWDEDDGNWRIPRPNEQNANLDYVPEYP